MDLKGGCYKFVNKLLTNIRRVLILKLVGDMAVIINCKVYDDVIEYNRKRNEYIIVKGCTIEKFSTHLNREVKIYESNLRKGVTRHGNSYVLSM